MFSQELTKEEAREWLDNLFGLLGQNIETMANKEATYQADAGICNTVLNVKVQATVTWPLRALVDGLLAKEELRVIGTVLKCAVEDPEGKKPTKLCTSRAKACLIKRLRFQPASLTGNYKIPLSTIFFVGSDTERPQPIVRWSAAE